MSRCSSRAFNTRGFTLIEVLVAFTIATIGAAIVFQVVARSAHSISLAEDYQRAAMLAETILSDPGQDWLDGGDFDIYEWEITQTPLDVMESVEREGGGTQERELELVRIAIAVNWTRGQREHVITVATEKLLNMDGDVVF